MPEDVQSSHGNCDLRLLPGGSHARIFWQEQTAADVPTDNQWLDPQELLHLGRLRFVKRRDDWRLGRWTAKRAVAACLGLPNDAQTLASIEIRPAPSGAPEVFLDQHKSVTISLSHRAGRALCVVALGGTRIGCDLELIEEHSEAFIADYFTDNEQALIRRTAQEQHSLLVTLLWSAKESALKALQQGLRLDTRCLEVSLPDPMLPGFEQFHPGLSPTLPVNSNASHDSHASWYTLRIACNDSRTFLGYWRHIGGLLRSVVWEEG